MWNSTFNAGMQVSGNRGFFAARTNSRPAVHSPSGTVFAQQVNGHVLAYASNGTVLWQASRCPYGVGGLTVEGDHVYTSGATLCALSRLDGSLGWSVNNTNTLEDQSTVAVYSEGLWHTVLAMGVGKVNVYRHLLWL